ncbi:MAG TPA: glycine--tRNA ligase [Verrucomicrobiota bacterium]|nr:glycine--tRNA ligase [Verrucomicrobiota bacterium]HNT14374.1 glycine--tRNA ligase [Verrucomicrobiota bacterium]
MAEVKENLHMEKIVSLCKRRGFIFQSSEIYGGINGFWDYGPLGAELKRNVKELWWRAMTRAREDVAGLEATIIMAPAIWKASGHVDTFSDPMCDCKKCKKRHRADQLCEDQGLALTKGDNGQFAFPAGTKCTHCGSTELTEPRPFNLMFKTYVGPIESEDHVAYLRPETAQAIFAQFKNVLETSRQKIPFGIAQIGKAFRNEVTPRNYTFRSREFEQMELEFFIKPDEAIEAIHGSVATVPVSGHPGEPQPNWGWQAWHQYWVEERVRFYEGLGLARATLSFHVQTADELAHYARATTDILFKFPFSKRDEKGELKGEELEGIAARSDFDLSQHQRFSGKPMSVFDEELRNAWPRLPQARQDALWQRYYAHRQRYLTRMGVAEDAAARQATEDANALAKGNYIPHVIEPSAGVDRLILALLTNAYTETVKTDDKGRSETLYVMQFHPRVAPIKVAVLPLLKNKPELVARARAVFELLRHDLACFYDEGGSIGKRYARQDEAGTPYCVTIDFDTLGENPELHDTVTLRYRDDGRQERLKISGLRQWLLEHVR